jgi:hypothetical protein
MIRRSASATRADYCNRRLSTVDHGHVEKEESVATHRSAPTTRMVAAVSPGIVY